MTPFIYCFLFTLLTLITSCEGATIERAFSLSRDLVSEMLILPCIVLFLGAILLVICFLIRVYQRKEISSYYKEIDEQHIQKQEGTFVPIRNSDGEIVSTIPFQIFPLIVILKMSYLFFCRIPHSNQERNVIHLKAGILFIILGLICLIAFLIPMSIGFSVVNNVMYNTSQPNMVNPNSFNLYYSSYIYACCLEVKNSYYALDQATYITTSTYDLQKLVQTINPLYCAFPQTENEHNGSSYGNFIDQVRGRAQAIEYAKVSCNAGDVIFVPDVLATVYATGCCGLSFGLSLLILGSISIFMGRNLSEEGVPRLIPSTSNSVLMNEVPIVQNRNPVELHSNSVTCELIGFSKDFKDSIVEGDEKKCCICLENRACCVLNPCGHSDFCHACTMKLIKDKAQCPICRTTFTSACKFIL